MAWTGVSSEFHSSWERMPSTEVEYMVVVGDQGAKAKKAPLCESVALKGAMPISIGLLSVQDNRHMPGPRPTPARDAGGRRRGQLSCSAMAATFARHARAGEGPRNRLSITSLPQYSASSSAVQEKFHRHPHLVRWWIPVAVPIPGLRSRRLRLYAPNVRQMHYSAMARFGRKRGSLVFAIALALFCFVVFAVGKRFGSRTKQWPTLREPPTLVFKRDDIQRIWEWEVSSGHYPSREPSECRSLSRRK